jgi:hypothetical protein
LHALPFLRYPIKPLRSITYLLEFGICIALAKPRKQVIFASFCDNIINHETKHLKYIFHVQYMMLDILIQVNEGIAKFFTFMLEGPLEQNYGV